MQTAMYINRLSISEYFGDPKLTETTGIKVFIVTRVAIGLDSWFKRISVLGKKCQIRLLAEMHSTLR